MFITTNLLKKINACDQDIHCFERFYPDGTELINVIRDCCVSKEFLHWTREFLINNTEEMAAYCAVCDIVNTTGFWYSANVHDSMYVAKSTKVKNSRSVFESIGVSNSFDIVNSDEVSDSKQIFYSSMVDVSEKLFKGTNVVESINVCNSTMVARSKNVIDSSNVFDSSEIIKCNTVTSSHFCQDCKNIENCMFCDGLENTKFCIFNKSIDENRYKMIEKQYHKYLSELLSFIREWPKDLVVNTFTAPTRKFDDWYSPIPEKFWKWARTLPGHDAMFLYKMTMLPQFLED